MASYYALTVSARFKLATYFNSTAVKVGVVDVPEARLYSILDNSHRTKLTKAINTYLKVPWISKGT